MREGTNESLLINFDMVSGSGADSRAVKVVPPPKVDRANAGTWYVADTDAANSVPHEFGHLIGLRDEYQLHPGDFRAITGREPDVGSTAGPVGVTPLRSPEPAGGDDGPQLGERVRGSRGRAAGRVCPAGRGAVRDAGRGDGAGGRAPAPGVAALPAVPLTTNLVRDLEAALVDNAALDKYNTIQVLTY